MAETAFAELVFAFVYPIGADANPVVNVLKNLLSQYQYTNEEFRVSDHLQSLDLGISVASPSRFSKMTALMDAGNAARKLSSDERIVSVMAINDIATGRDEDEQQRPVPRTRTAHLIRSLKRPEEVMLLREVYRPGFFLIGIAADDDLQHTYLTKELGLLDEEASILIARDQDEGAKFGQRTRDTFYLADVFIQRADDAYKGQLARFLEIVFGHPFRTPRKEEHAMFMAYASAARSAQLGRQVGAAITTPEGEVVAVGMNEVPRSGGGPYWEEENPDFRDHEKKLDSNFQQRDLIVKSVVGKLRENLMTSENLKLIFKDLHSKLDETATQEQIDELVSDWIEKVRFRLIDESTVEDLVHESDLRDITEYGRAVHGEMDAILTCARLGISVKGKVLYATTFPCHNCTRHIIAAGIERVYYIEPYPKSKARDLHSDAICFSDDEVGQNGKIPFLPFIGIGPL